MLIEAMADYAEFVFRREDGGDTIRDTYESACGIF
jgi:hypothetical protein